MRIIKSTPLLLQIETSRGTGSKTLDLEHPWAAPIRRGIREGTPTGTWQYTTIDDLRGTPRILGAFVFTEAKRTLFCPGCEILVSPIEPSDESKELVPVEHLTLDPQRRANKRSSHVVTQKHGGRGPRNLDYTSPLKDGYMFPWFSIILPDLNVLEVLPQKILLPHEMPNSDLPRRPKPAIGELKSSATAAFASPPPEGPSYVQFDVWATDQSNWSGLKAQTFSYDGQPSQERATGQHDNQLVEDECGIRILAHYRSGEVERPIILRPRLETGDAELI